MKLLGRNFDFGAQKLILFITMFTGVVFSFSATAFSLHMFSVFYMDLNIILIGFYVSYAVVMSVANLSLFVLYMFLVLSTKMRFQQVNHYLRYVKYLFLTILNYISTSRSSAMVFLPQL